MTDKRGSWVWHPELECLVPKAQYLQGKDNRIARSDVPFPAIRGDAMPEMRSMLDGRIYESKSAYYKSVSRAGCHIVGYDRNWSEHVQSNRQTDKAHEADIASDVQRAVQEVASRTPTRRRSKRSLH